MFKNYIVTAFRNLFKHKFYSLLNILGLATGIAACLMILLWVMNELSYDKHFENSERIYRLAVDFKFGGQENRGMWIAPPTGYQMKQDIPGIEEQARLRQFGNFTVQYKDDIYKEEGVVFADSAFFSIFKIPFVKGDPVKALAKPNQCVISESLAEKYFGDDNPIGKTLELDGTRDYTVTGVFKDIPENTHFDFDLAGSLSTYDVSRGTHWLANMSFRTYFLLKEGVSADEIESKFPDMTEKFVGADIQEFMGGSYEEFLAVGNYVKYFLQPVEDIHLYSKMSGELTPAGDITYVYIFSAIALFILLIACINFMNLSTARSANRAREVGLRKVLGSYKSQLVFQFLAESLLMAVLAFGIAIALTILLLPYFNDLSGKDFTIGYLFDTGTMLLMFAVLLIAGFLSGTYPAVFLSSFRPVRVLKGEVARGAKSGKLRSALVIFQFTATIVLIICTLVVFNQLNYIQNKKLGYEKDQVIIINDTWIIRESVDSFKERLLRNPQIISATVSSYLPTPSNRGKNVWWKKGDPAQNETTPVDDWRVDVDLIPTLNMKLSEGRNFSKDFPTDSMAVVVNEAFVKQFNLENPVGEYVQTYTGIDPPEISTYKIIGVVKNFHIESMKARIQPLIMRLLPSTGFVAARFKAENVSELITFIENTWNEFAPGQPFGYSFMDEEFEATYRDEVRIGEIFSVFAVLAIFVGCLGLLGLAAFTAEQRTREIGIRKVLGASVGGLVLLLSKEFSRLVLISFVIAAPIAWYVMSGWLEDFAYRTELDWVSFALAGLAAFVIAFITVSYHAARAALLNPVKAVKYE